MMNIKPMCFVARTALVLIVVSVCTVVVFAQPTSLHAKQSDKQSVSRRGVAGPKPIEPRPKLDVHDFRSIIVGDSQTTDPNATRIRTQTHRWDAPIVGELVCVGSSLTGFVVNNADFGITNLTYSNIDMNEGWDDGGPDDFFGLFGAQWSCSGNVTATGARIGRYRLRFGNGNTDAPWNQPWGVGQALVARIAVRTSPMCVDAVETRADRGNVSSFSSRTVHTLSKEWGVQVIEQHIPADFNPKGDDVGVGLYLPSSSVQMAGQVLQVLGVLIERVDADGRRLPGTLIGYQGRGGWSMDEHINRISRASRMALIEMCDADQIMVIQGHNREPGGTQSVVENLNAVVNLWEEAYAFLGRNRPGFVFVVPWAISGKTASEYLLEVERAMVARAAMNRNDSLMNFLPLHDYTRPDLFDPSLYMLDTARVHPGDVPTAINLSRDLYEMLFEGRRK
jgi:hypothetical protein